MAEIITGASSWRNQSHLAMDGHIEEKGLTQHARVQESPSYMRGFKISTRHVRHPAKKYRTPLLAMPNIFLQARQLIGGPWLEPFSDESLQTLSRCFLFGWKRAGEHLGIDLLVVPASARAFREGYQHNSRAIRRLQFHSEELEPNRQT